MFAHLLRSFALYDTSAKLPRTDLGYDDLGHDSVMGNSGKSYSPNINKLMDDGIILHDYYTFKVCSPTRASLLTGRYPWGAGFYDMSNDGDHCTDQFRLVADLLKEAGYTTHALGKVRRCIVVACACLHLNHQRLLCAHSLSDFSGTLATSLSRAPQHAVVSIHF
eukprot:COSAG02_NODE_5042_length_4700_cov_4.582790_6_plen_165_part_00